MITGEMLDNAIGGKGQSVQTRDIIAAVSGVTGISEDAIKGRSRKEPVLRARHIAIWLCVTLCPLTLTGIGLRFGGRDHSTVIHVMKKIDGYMRSAVGAPPGALHYERDVLRTTKAAFDVLQAGGLVSEPFVDLLNKRI